jgi:hypothetical protein
MAEPTESDVRTPDVESIEPLSGAKAVARGTARMFARHDILVLQEVSLRNKRRTDLMGIDGKGQIIIVEIKVARGDLLGDDKWTEYLEYCDRFYWAIPADFDASPLDREEFLPERSGLIIADSYDAEIVRPAATYPLAAARRKVETMRLARRAMRRLSELGGWIRPLMGEIY